MNIGVSALLVVHFATVISAECGGSSSSCSTGFVLGRQESLLRYVYYKEVTKHYKFHVEAKLWGDALATCQSESATLALPENDAEVRVVRDIFEAYPISVIPQASSLQYPNHTLLGFHKYDIKGEFMALNGKPLRLFYNKFDVGEPNLYPSQIVGAMHRSGFYHDYPIELPCTYICERQDSPSDYYNAECQNSDREYEAFGTSCYKIHTAPEVWYKAEQVCREEGAMLAVIDDEMEDRVVRNRMMTSLLKGDTKGTVRSYAFIGFQDIYKEGYYVTVFGKHISSLGYLRWSQTFDKNLPETKDCGMLTADGIGYTMCNVPSQFICEKIRH